MSEAFQRDRSNSPQKAGGGASAQVETFKYDNCIVRAFAIATVVWGIVGMAAGLLVATQMFWPGANLNLSFITFGRLRPLHTNAVIFAFVGNGMFMGIYYSLQRLCKARMFSDLLSWVNFWGWQAIIVSAAASIRASISRMVSVSPSTSLSTKSMSFLPKELHRAAGQGQAERRRYQEPA